MPTTQTMARNEARVQKHILRRVVLALGQRSWNWLAQESGVPQSTLATQYKRPRFTLETLIAIAPALKKPVVWFFPGTPEAEAEAEAFRRVAEIVREVHG